MIRRKIETSPEVVNKAVLYLRYSSDSQTEQSIEGQRRDCVSYCRRNGIEVIGEYVDRAKTGTSAETRPEFQRMIRDSESKTFGKVVVWKTDCFSRDRLDALTYKAILGQNGVRLVSVQEPLIEGPEGIMMEGLIDSVNEYYSAELSVKVKRGLKENVIKGKSLGGVRRFGYKIKDGRYEIDPVEGPIVQEAFRLYAEDDISILAIAKEFEKKGYKDADGKRITHQRLEKMLQSDRYIGVLRCDGQENRDAIPRLISDELFMKAQVRRTKHKHKNYALRADDEYVLSGKTFCRKCGSQFLGETGTSCTGRIYSYYKCNGAKNHKCDAKPIPKDILEKTIASQVLWLLTESPDCDELIDSIYELQSKERPELVEMRNRLEDVNKRIANFIDAIGRGILTDTTKEELLKLEAEKKELEGKISSHQLRHPSYTKEEIEEALKDMSMYGTEDPKSVKALLNRYVKRVDVLENGDIEVFFDAFGSNRGLTIPRESLVVVRTNTPSARQLECILTLYVSKYGFGLEFRLTSRPKPMRFR